jgi:hypothetical protein
MPDPEVKRANEQRKLMASIISNVGTALFVAGFGRWWVEGGDLFVFLWIFSGVGITWVGVKVLSLMEAE